MIRPLILVAALAAPLQVLAQAPAAPAQPPTAVAEPENALTYLKQAQAALQPYEDAKPSPEQARDAVEANQKVFPLLQRAVELPLRFEKRNFVQAQFSVFASVRQMARLLALRAQVQAESGDANGAVDSGLLCLRLGMKMQEDGALISSLVAYAVEAIGLKSLQKLAPQLDAAQLKIAARGLGEVEARRPAFSIVLASEREVSLELMRQQFEAQKPAPFDAPTLQRLLVALREAAERDDDLLSRPYALTRAVDFHEPEPEPDDADEDVPPVVGPGFDAGAWAEATQKSVRPVKHSTLLNRTGAQARLALLETALATRAFQLEQHAPPASLQVLVPGYLSALPLDPFELNAALKLKSGEDGVRIYSVGPDGFDDGGQAIEERGLGVDSVGDVVAPPQVLKP